MTDYSKNKINFNNINFAQITYLLKIVSNSEKREVEFLKQKFQRQSFNFEDTLELLLLTKCLLKSGKELASNIALKNLDKDSIRNWILTQLFSKKNYSTSGIKDYFKNFVFKNDSYEFSAGNKKRLSSSGIRNFLIDLKFLTYDQTNDCYSVSKDALKYLPIEQQKQLSPNQLSKRLARIEALGLEAEKVILEFEKEQLKHKPTLAIQIEHTSLVYVNAGYDIKSFETNSGSLISAKYIEVKAVANTDGKFYWSKNEIEVAKRLKKQYYLYLLPLNSEKIFDIKKLIIIQDPYVHIFKKRNVWKGEMELMSFIVP